jgi:hypothetical protein
MGSAKPAGQAVFLCLQYLYRGYLMRKKNVMQKRKKAINNEIFFVSTDGKIIVLAPLD